MGCRSTCYHSDQLAEDPLWVTLSDSRMLEIALETEAFSNLSGSHARHDLGPSNCSRYRSRADGVGVWNTRATSKKNKARKKHNMRTGSSQESCQASHMPHPGSPIWAAAGHGNADCGGWGVRVSRAGLTSRLYMFNHPPKIPTEGVLRKVPSKLS